MQILLRTGALSRKATVGFVVMLAC